jgi:putative nucleotidyltransferase with HDIG domain
MEGPLNSDQAYQASQAYLANLEVLVAARTEQLRTVMREMERCYDITLLALGDALRLKDPGIASHSQRVTAFSIAICRALGVPKDQIDVIVRGASLHDIGMLGVPEAILRKPGALSAEETASMREHCNAGYQLLRKIPFLAHTAEVVFAHHERYDGTGYPRGLKGDRVPIGARICAVAEAFDTITSDRPYSKAQSLEAARAEIMKGSGRQFDPTVVRIFLEIHAQVWDSLRSEIQSRG